MKKLRIIYIPIFFVLFSLVLFACNKTSQRAKDFKNADSSIVKIVTTTPFITETTKKITDVKNANTFLIYDIIPLDKDPSKYKLSKSDKLAINSADLVFVQGLNYEKNVINYLKKNNIVFSDIGQLILDEVGVAEYEGNEPKPFNNGILYNDPTNHEKGYNPHYWMDLELFKLAIRKIHTITSKNEKLKEFILDRMYKILYGNPEDDTPGLLNEISSPFIDSLQTYINNESLKIPNPLKKSFFITDNNFYYFSKFFNYNVLNINNYSPEELTSFITRNSVTPCLIKTIDENKKIRDFIQAGTSKNIKIIVSEEKLRLTPDIEKESLNDFIKLYKYNIDIIIKTILKALSK